jgi:acyl-CoA thioester hydrolase
MAARDAYPMFQDMQTRWNDNDSYQHVNNVTYLSYFDTVINAYLVREGGLVLEGGEGPIGLCVESHCRYMAPVSFPDLLEVGVRVEHIGRSSVRYGVILLRHANEAPAAEGWFVHVFVDRHTRRPAPIPQQARAALERLLVAPTRAAS